MGWSSTYFWRSRATSANCQGESRTTTTTTTTAAPRRPGGRDDDDHLPPDAFVAICAPRSIVVYRDRRDDDSDYEDASSSRTRLVRFDESTTGGGPLTCAAISPGTMDLALGRGRGHVDVLHGVFENVSEYLDRLSEDDGGRTCDIFPAQRVVDSNVFAPPDSLVVFVEWSERHDDGLLGSTRRAGRLRRRGRRVRRRSRPRVVPTHDDDDDDDGGGRGGCAATTAWSTTQREDDHEGGAFVRARLNGIEEGIRDATASTMIGTTSTAPPRQRAAFLGRSIVRGRRDRRRSGQGGGWIAMQNKTAMIVRKDVYR